MKDSQEHIQSIYKKLQTLVKRYDTLQKEHYKLRQQLDFLKEEKLELEKRLMAAEQKLNVTSLQASALSPAQKTALKKKLDDYIKEIDKCLQKLNA